MRSRGIVSQALICALAFNLTFLLQEATLALTKTLLPGIHPILYHNNHDWTGLHPRIALFQGFGAAADVASGFLFAALLAARRTGNESLRWFFFWMTFQGFYQALPQVLIGAMVPANDVGMAMTYLGFTTVLCGTVCIQLAALLRRRALASVDACRSSAILWPSAIGWPAAALAVLLFLFQFGLRPGIRF